MRAPEDVLREDTAERQYIPELLPKLRKAKSVAKVRDLLEEVAVHGVTVETVAGYAAIFLTNEQRRLLIHATYSPEIKQHVPGREDLPIGDCYCDHYQFDFYLRYGIKSMRKAMGDEFVRDDWYRILRYRFGEEQAQRVWAQWSLPGEMAGCPYPTIEDMFAAQERAREAL